MKEKFAAYYAEQSFFFTLAEKKKGLSYRHCASAVARLPQLDFLADVVPQTIKFSDTEPGKKLLARQKSGSTNQNDNEIPEWARAHPEALSKIQAAQDGRMQDPVTGSSVDHDMSPSTASTQLLSASKKPSSSPTLPHLLNEDSNMSNT